MGAEGIDASLLFGLGLYLLVMIVVGVWTSRFMGSLDDFALVTDSGRYSGKNQGL
ncbi:MAG: hypothetical protein AAF533_24520 [Acidobacteriota bacterium]